MDPKELQRICEAILFAAGEPVETERLSFVTETDPDEVREALRELADAYAFERRGIRILRLEDSWQMCSQNDLAPWVTKALETRKPPKLSASQLETLTIIAYYQPTTKAFVEKLRGVDSAYSVSALLNKKLIEENGRLDAPGRPILYRTTADFLRTFGLESLEDLPEMEKVNFSAAAELPEEAAPAPESLPLEGKVPPKGADEAESRQANVTDEALRATNPTSSVTASPRHLPLKGKAEDGAPQDAEGVKEQGARSRERRDGTLPSDASASAGAHSVRPQADGPAQTEMEGIKQ